MTQLLKDALERAATWERHYVPSVPQPPLTEHIRSRSWEDRLASNLTEFAGSMKFVYLHSLWFCFWVLGNVGLLFAFRLGLRPFDPYPFGLPTLIVSLEAIFLSTFVMIAQNRLSALADARVQLDYKVNLRVEAEVTKVLHLVESLLAHHILVAEEAAAKQGVVTKSS